MTRSFLGAAALLAAALVVTGPPATTAAANPAATPAATSAPSTFTAVSPVRVLDTRTGTGTGGSTSPVGGGGTITLELASRVPATATAVVLNVTGVAPTASTFVTVFPGGTTRPTASNLNLSPGDTRPNQVTVSLGANRTVSLYNNAGSTHLVADLAGHYGTGAGAKFTALPTGRVLDTRLQPAGPVGAGETRTVGLGDRIPASATAVTVNLTATNATATTYVTAFPAGTPVPTASNLNVPAGDTRPNLVTVAVGDNRTISLYNNAGSVDLVVDLAGFHTPDYGAVFLPQSPTRVLDTRSGSPFGAGSSRNLSLTAATPLTATGVALNVTGVAATAPTYVTAWAQGNPIRGEGSVLNLSPGQTVPNAAVVAFETARGIQLYNDSGAVHLIADVAGVFAVDEAACTTDCVLAWGDNRDRRLGTAQAVPSSPTPTAVPGLSGVRTVVAGGANGAGYALMADGTVRAWGSNLNGQLGNGWRGGGSATPVPVLGLANVTALSSSGRFALRADGTVWTWGSNDNGELGNGAWEGSTVPVQVSNLTGVVAIADAGGTVFALRADGTVWSWGGNYVGQLGTGSFTDLSRTPVQVTGLTDVVAIGGGAGAGFAVRADGTVWAWGSNSHGELGTGEPCPTDPNARCESRVPVRIPSLTGVTATAAGGSVYALRADGTVWAWGMSHNGRLGNGVLCGPVNGTCESRVPVQVSNLTDATAVADHTDGGYALRADGTVWGWGSGWQDALGTGVTTYSTVPVRIAGLAGVTALHGSFHAGYAVVPNP